MAPRNEMPKRAILRTPVRLLGTSPRGVYFGTIEVSGNCLQVAQEREDYQDAHYGTALFSWRSNGSPTISSRWAVHQDVNVGKGYSGSGW
jgi:hypothetical protein